MSNFLQVFYVLFSAVLVSLAIPNEILPLGSPYIALFSLIPFYIALSRCRSYREAFWLSGLQIIVVHLISSLWLAFFKDFAIFTLGASAVATGFLGAVFGIILYLPFSRETPHTRLIEAAGSDTRRIPLRIFWFAGVYTLYEWYKSTGFLGYPWGTLSSTAFRWRLFMQTADLAGTYGVTFLFALFSSVCAEGILLASRLYMSPNPHSAFTAFRNCARTCIVLIACAFMYGAVQYAVPRRPVKILNTVMVQQNYNPWNSANDDDTILLSERLTEDKINELIRQGSRPDLVVWSEGVLQHAFPYSAEYYTKFPFDEPLSSFIGRMNTPFIIGGSYLADAAHRSFNNAALLFDKTGTFRGSYGKIHLVPFAEVIPGIEYKWVQTVMQKVVGISAGWKTGDQYVYFDIPGSWASDSRKPDVKVIPLDGTASGPSSGENTAPTVRVSTPICFDDSFPEVCRPLFLNGSELFMNITDDSWSLMNSAEYQHFIIASYRAIEYRTTLARSTNAGVSVVLDPAARILSEMPLFVADSTAVSIPVYKRQITVYALFGNWLPWLIALLAACYFVYAVATGNRPEDVPGERFLQQKTKKRRAKEPKKAGKGKKTDSYTLLTTY
ncbi:MAG TPA: apolipoprotein N-acyltransferase [Treponema sp.]|nr:apolipoprotein N-acyltransferase [Treponema sp.]